MRRWRTVKKHAYLQVKLGISPAGMLHLLCALAHLLGHAAAGIAIRSAPGCNLHQLPTATSHSSLPCLCLHELFHHSGPCPVLLQALGLRALWRVHSPSDRHEPLELLTNDLPQVPCTPVA